MTMTFSGIISPTVSSEPGYLQFFRASMSAGASAATTLAISLTKSTNSGVLEAKSVSALTSTTTPTPFSTVA